jgi:hypothetical protein
VWKELHDEPRLGGESDRAATFRMAECVEFVGNWEVDDEGVERRVVVLN